MYHVSLDLAGDQVVRLKMAALKKGVTVKALVTTLVVDFLSKQPDNLGAGAESRGGESAKTRTK